STEICLLMVDAGRLPVEPLVITWKYTGIETAAVASADRAVRLPASLLCMSTSMRAASAGDTVSAWPSLLRSAAWAGVKQSPLGAATALPRSEEHTSELQSRVDLV